jgi:NAD(P)-dependent dehydrogenase (short-subunit alcohol dehydrogenase family)
MTKTILISGAAQGIGRVLARRFAEKGNRVFLHDLNEEELEHTVNVYLKQYASQVHSSLCNLRDTTAVREAVLESANFFDGHIDVLINNGGISNP